MPSFIPKTPGIIDKIVADFKSADNDLDKLLMKKMNEIVNVVYRTARSKRPKISKEQHEAMGRKSRVGGKSAYRVSDPDASTGVPVKSGDLQISIKKEVVKKKGKIIGRVYVDGPGAPYAAYMEFGTSKIRARSFLRSSMNVNRDWIKRKWEEKQK